MLETEKGICRLCLVPIFMEPTFNSLQVSELLFGEHYEVIDHDKKWVKIKVHFNGADGWIMKAQHYFITHEYFDQVNNSDYKICTDLTANIFFKKHYLNILIGSILPISTSELFKIEEQLAFNGNSKSLGQRRDYVFLRETIQKYMYAPYRKGGRTPFGIDDIGMVQQVYRVAGYPMPRNIEALHYTGEAIQFSESENGDMIIWETDRNLKTGIKIGEKQAVVVTDSVKIIDMDDKGNFTGMQGKLVKVQRILKI